VYDHLKIPFSFSHKLWMVFPNFVIPTLKEQPCSSRRVPRWFLTLLSLAALQRPSVGLSWMPFRSLGHELHYLYHFYSVLVGVYIYYIYLNNLLQQTPSLFYSQLYAILLTWKIVKHFLVCLDPFNAGQASLHNSAAPGCFCRPSSGWPSNISARRPPRSFPTPLLLPTRAHWYLDLCVLYGIWS
jgi:hypothetical protein